MHESTSRADHLGELIDHAAHLLPAQGPINVFVHHNTLHAFEQLPFAEAVLQGARRFGNEPYLDENTYRLKISRGRIRFADLDAVLAEDLGTSGQEMVADLASRFALRQAMLQHPLLLPSNEELPWCMAEGGALRRMRPDAAPVERERLVGETRRWVMRDMRRERGAPAGDRRTQQLLEELFTEFGANRIERWSTQRWEAFCLNLLWQICRQGVHGVPQAAARETLGVRPRDWLLAITGEDTDPKVHEQLIRFCASFLDQGLADWTLPERETGFFQSFLALYDQPWGSPAIWLNGLRPLVARLRRDGVGALDFIAECLAEWGIAAADEEEFVKTSMLALRGWGGMVWQIESRADRAVRPVPPGSLVEMLAVRLLLERLALADAWSRFRKPGQSVADMHRDATHKIARRRSGPSHDQRAFVVFQLAQVLGWSPAAMVRLERPRWHALLHEIEEFSELERRRVYHLAYERRYRVQVLDAVTEHGQRGPAESPTLPRAQVVTCIDEREESFRRHLEEIAPDIETFGVAGFFNVAMYYRGAAEAHFFPLCPVVIRPQHYVQEDVVADFATSHERRARMRVVLGRVTHGLHRGSRGFAGGAFLTALAGPLASIPLLARVLFPRLTSRLRRSAGKIVRAPTSTCLRLERTSPTPGPEPDQLGFTVQEMTDIVERVLRDIGLTSGFARLVVLVGHGSGSLNNPHRAAYDCGACGGGRGGPNARAVAQMANDPRVRRGLFERKLVIPQDVLFVGAYHNTCDDSIELFDVESFPSTHTNDLAALRRSLDTAREHNAQERCRRFESAELSLSPAAALQHVEARSENLAQARPECGHATNAICIVGRRQRTRGLFCDRRAFLVSYDPTQDTAENAILARILGAVVPVCGGINLEYYFSFVDPAGWGCGTKLPHNVTALLGVMDGAASDLRPGLPVQMTEIHEPVRLLFVIEATPEAVRGIMAANDTIGRLVQNEWVQVALLDPEREQLLWYHAGQFQPYEPESRELPEVASSGDWYRGWRGDLGFARVPVARATTTPK